ncbi:MAG: hypothetical protein HC854_07355 [Flavobacterium sp.]|nr:hypothetical protein [Flavobacterium sp.]
MKDKNQNKKQVNEPVSVYKIKKQQGIGADFDFDREFAKGLTVEEARAEMHKRIAKWNWEK